MDSEFPDPDEEFDLVHADEFELLNELEDFEGKINITYLLGRFTPFTLHIYSISRTYKYF